MTGKTIHPILSGLITILPSHSGENILYWQVQDGVITACEDLQLGGTNSLFPPTGPDNRVLALVRTTDTVLGWSAVGDLSRRQAETAARIAAVQKSLGPPADIHAVAVLAPNLPTAGADTAADNNANAEYILTASISAAVLQSGLDILAAAGCDPDIVLPAGLAMTPPLEGYLRAQIGAYAFVRGSQLVLPDEPSLVAAIIGDTPVAELSTAQIENDLATAFAAPAMNLRTGTFAKRRARGGITAAQWKILAMILSAGLIASLLLALLTWVKYDRAIAREDAKTLSAIQKIVPAATNVTDGQKSLNDALARRGDSGAQVTPLTASVYSVVQQVPAVTLRDIRYNGDGILAFTLASSNVDGINQALLIMQQQGYKVTATPRQDASGTAMADISMRTR